MANWTLETATATTFTVETQSSAPSFTNETESEADNYLLLQNGDYILLQSGDLIIIGDPGLPAWTNETEN